MDEIQTVPSYLPPVDRNAALQKKEEINSLLAQINSHELRLARSYARLGSALKEVKVEQYWLAWGYDRFSNYLEYIWETIGKKRSQVYMILSVAEVLLPYVSENQLEEIGISKAYELKRLVAQGGNVQAEITLQSELPEIGDEFIQIMDYAARPKVTAAQLRVRVNELLHIHEDNRGTWFDIEGFYATADERKEIAEFWELGRKILQLSSETSDDEIRKQVFLAAIRESTSTWQGELNNAE